MFISVNTERNRASPHKKKEKVMMSFICLAIVAIGFIIASFIKMEKQWIGDTIMGVGLLMACVHSFICSSFIMAIIYLVLTFVSFIVAYTEYHNNK